MGPLGLFPESIVTETPSSTVVKNAYSCTPSAVRIKIGVQVTSTLIDGLVRRPQRKFDHRFTLPGVENLREVCTEGEEGVRIYGEAHCVYGRETKKIRFSCTKLFTVR